MTKKKEPKKRGRPEGSRNKSTLMKARVFIDDYTIEAVHTLKALMDNDKVALNCEEDVPYSIRFNACKEFLSKSIANEKAAESGKEKLPIAQMPKSFGPKVFSQAK